MLDGKQSNRCCCGELWSAGDSQVKCFSLKIKGLVERDGQERWFEVARQFH
jgi:hypothetical protein